MSFSVAQSACGLSVYNGCRQVGNQLYVTGQPYPAGYAQIAAAGVRWVVCVRNPDETAPPAPPFDSGEAATLLASNVLYVDVPITHGMPQAAFDQAATVAAVMMLALLRQGQVLIHCSSGDRASAVFAVALIATRTLSNVEAVAFASTELLLANAGIKQQVLAYVTPSWFYEWLGESAGPLKAEALTK
jgi:uncharacterized protein (TIGR01244 family)